MIKSKLKKEKKYKYNHKGYPLMIFNFLLIFYQYFVKFEHSSIFYLTKDIINGFEIIKNFHLNSFWFNEKIL